MNRDDGSIAREQHLWDLSCCFHAQATANRHKIRTKQHLREYYTLIKLSIACLRKIIALKHRATRRLRIKCHIRLATLLVEEVDLEHSEESPETLLSEASLLAAEDHSMQYLRFQAEYALIKLMMSKGNNRQVLREISNCVMKDSLLFRFLRFECIALEDPLHAHRLLTAILSSDQLQTCHSDFISLVQLTEVAFCMQHGIMPVTNLDNVRPTAKLLEALKVCSYSMSCTHSLESRSIASVRKKFLADIGTILDLKPEICIPYTYLTHTLELSVTLPTVALQRIQIHLHEGINFLNRSSDSLQAKQLFDQAFTLTETEITRLSTPWMKAVRYNDQQLQQLYKIQDEIYFHHTLSRLSSYHKSSERNSKGTKSGFEGVATNDLSKLLPVIKGDLQSYCHRIKDPLKLLYISALVNHSYGYPDAAISLYRKLIHDLEHTNNYRYNEFYQLAVLNLYAFTESLIVYCSKGSMLGRATSLFELRSEAQEKLAAITSSQHNNVMGRYPHLTTINFINMLFNPGNRLSMQDVSQLLGACINEFEALKNFPLLASMVLQLFSSTLNENSDERQKTSEAAFSLARRGFFPLIRYTSGLAAAKNAESAKNLETFEVLTAKLDIMQTNLETIFTPLFEYLNNGSLPTTSSSALPVERGAHPALTTETKAAAL